MFRAYRPPPVNQSSQTINAAAPLIGTVLGGAAGAYFGGPQGAMSGMQMGAGLGSAAAGLATGGPDQERRVGAGLGLGMQGVGQYLNRVKRYGDPQTGDPQTGAPRGTVETQALSQAIAPPPYAYQDPAASADWGADPRLPRFAKSVW